ncbi:MAG: elongation factor G [Miltoncostaeaceae bacterium]
MAYRDPSTIRNVAVVGHRGSGKTSLVEAMLFASGSVSRLGSVPEGTTVSDWDPDEQRRATSIAASLCHTEWQGVKINFLDTPGEPSFAADTLSSLAAVESALFTINATAGVEVQTERLIARSREMGLGRAAVITMIERERADFDATMDALREAIPGAVAIQIPMVDDERFTGLINLVSMTAVTYDGSDPAGETGEIPADHQDAAQAARDAMFDVVAEADDVLIEKYLEGAEITTEELIGAIVAGVARGSVCPVLCAAPTVGGAGADRVLDLLVEALPAPTEFSRTGVDPDGAATELTPDESGPLVVSTFKTLADQFSGRVNLLRVVSGALPPDTQVVNGRTGDRERVGQLFTLQGKEHVALDAIGPGDIGAVAKLKDVMTGDALTDGPSLSLPAVHYPEAVMTFAVAATDQADEDKMNSSLRRMTEEDPSLTFGRDEQTGELILGGLSQMHVEVIAERVRDRFGVEIELRPPRVPYLETITTTAEAEGKHKKQSGGRGQFGDCWLRVEPQPRGKGFEFVNKIVGGAIPRPFIPAVKKGVVEAMEAGELAGYPLVDVRVTVYDGKHHAVDSSEMAFKIAGSIGMKAAVAKAKPVLLEPIMTAEVTVPNDYVGDVMGDLNSRRGHPLGMEGGTAGETIRAEVPMAEMLSYAPDLRAMTHGRGEYTMEFLRYQEVPAHLAEAIASRGEDAEEAAA